MPGIFGFWDTEQIIVWNGVVRVRWVWKERQHLRALRWKEKSTGDVSVPRTWTSFVRGCAISIGWCTEVCTSLLHPDVRKKLLTSSSENTLSIKEIEKQQISCLASWRSLSLTLKNKGRQCACSPCQQVSKCSLTYKTEQNSNALISRPSGLI